MPNHDERLRRLGAGETIEQVCASDGLSREEFDVWWQEELRSRLPRPDGNMPATVTSPVTIARDGRGVPHVFAGNDRDLFIAFGLAMAQDRLFQLDFLRRKAKGELAAVIGRKGLETDVVARTVGMHLLAQQEWDNLPPETRDLLTAFTEGINHWINSDAPRPIEFSLLDYEMEPWQPTDCLAIESDFRWYLTGRLPVIATPELAKRVLGDGDLYREFLLGEEDEESIVHAGEFSPVAVPSRNMGHSFSSPEEGTGSNNWVVNGDRSVSGLPLVASDPHIAMEAVSCWYQVRLTGGSFDVAGMAAVGMPAVMFGRNPSVSWSITNNICSQRDLYQEQINPENPDLAFFNGEWEKVLVRPEVIQVRGEDRVTKTVRTTRNGPIVDELLPVEAAATGPVSLNWVGLHGGGWLTAMLDMDRAQNVDEFRAALEPWHVPTFALLFADTQGNIGFQASGRLPHRTVAERAYRPGWEPEHQWQGLIGPEGMPQLKNPDRGWIATANNRVAPDDFPQPMEGRWGSGHRARRLRRLLVEQDKHDLGSFAGFQRDHLSMRAVECVPPLLETLAASKEVNLTLNSSILALQKWDCCMDEDSAAALIFNVFFTFWSERVAAERFADNLTTYMGGFAGGIANRLLSSDPHGWFVADREEAIRLTYASCIDYLCGRFGAEVSQWKWGDVHRTTLNHWLSGFGDLGLLLNLPSVPVRGDMITVGNTGCGADWSAKTGGGYRLISDMATSPPSLIAVDVASQSGQPGSPHYNDQFSTWQAGEYFRITLDREITLNEAKHVTELTPQI